MRIKQKQTSTSGSCSLVCLGIVSEREQYSNLLNQNSDSIPMIRLFYEWFLLISWFIDVIISSDEWISRLVHDGRLVVLFVLFLHTLCLHREASRIASLCTACARRPAHVHVHAGRWCSRAPERACLRRHFACPSVERRNTSFLFSFFRWFVFLCLCLSARQNQRR